jgi:hypothetical protein
MPSPVGSRSNLAIADRSLAGGNSDLDEEHLRLLNERVAASEEAERRGETIAFEDLLDEVDQILDGPAAG